MVDPSKDQQQDQRHADAAETFIEQDVVVEKNIRKKIGKDDQVAQDKR